MPAMPPPSTATSARAPSASTGWLGSPGVVASQKEPRWVVVSCMGLLALLSG
jgi:hypothetical protein